MSCATPPATLPFACVFAANAAPGAAGLGGDVLATQGASGLAAVALGPLASVASRAAAGGGSIALQALLGPASLAGAVFNGSAAGAPAGLAAGAGNGGALSLLQIASLAASNLSFSGCAASFGGAIYVATRNSDESAAAAAALVVSGLTYDANFAAQGGGNEFFLTGTAITRLGVVRQLRPSTAAYGANVSTSVRVASISSAYMQALTTAGGAQGILVVSSTPTALPAALVQPRDAFGVAATTDNGTTCLVSAVRNDTGALVPLGFAPTYTATNGIVALQPFSVLVGPNLLASMTLACTSQSGRALPPLTSLLGTGIVQVLWTAATTASPAIYVSPSTTQAVRAVSRPIQAAIADASGTTLTNVAISCSLSVASAANPDGSPAAATLLGLTTVTSVAGIATFSPGMSMPLNGTAQLACTCIYTTGDLVSSPTTLTVTAFAVALQWNLALPPSACPNASARVALGSLTWSPAGAPNCTPPAAAGGLPALGPVGTAAAGGAQLTLLGSGGAWSALRATAVSFLQALDAALLLPSALPSPLNAALVQALAPAPAVTVVQTTRDGSIASAVNTAEALSCSIAAATSGQTAIGNLASTSVNGTASFPLVGIGSALMGNSSALVVSCAWPGGQTVVSLPLTLRLQVLTAAVSTPPPGAALSSAPAGGAVLALLPAPALQLSVQDPMRGTVTPLTTLLSCSAALLNSSWTPRPLQGSGPAAVALVGDLSASSGPSGLATFVRLGIAAPGGASAFLRMSCAWTTGETFGATAGPVLVPLLSLALAAPLAPTLPSTAAQPIFYAPAPAVAVTASAGSLASANTTLLALLAGNSIACSATPQLVSGGAAPLVGSGAAQLSSSAGTASWPQLGIGSALNVSVNVSFSCALPSGESVGCISPAVRAPLLAINVTAPAAVLPSASTFSAATFVALSPPPTVLVLADGALASAAALAGYSMPCIAAAVAVGSSPAVALVGTTSAATTGSSATFTQLGVSGSFGSVFQLQVTCTWVTGVTLVALSAPVRVSTLTLNVTSPAVVLPSASTGGSLVVPMSPAPAISMSVDNALVTSLGFAVPCTASSATATLVGNLTALAPASSAAATLPGLGAYGAFGASFTVSVTCTWISGATFAAQSATVRISTLTLNVLAPASVLPSAASFSAATFVAMTPAPNITVLQDGVLVSSLAFPASCSATTVAVGSSPSVQLVGTASASTNPTGVATFSQLGASAGFGAAFSLQVQCSWISGATFTAQSATVRISTLSLNVSAPASVLASASTGGASIVPISPAPVITMSQDGVLVSSLGFAVTCAASSSAAQLVGTLSTSSSATAATATLSGLGAYGAFGLSFTISVQCTWISGATFTALSPAMRIATLTLSVTAPSFVLPSSTSGSPLLPMSPSPALTILQDGSAVASLGFPVTCTASSGAAQLVGNLSTSTLPTTATAAYPGLGAFASFGTSFTVSVTCTWSK